MKTKETDENNHVGNVIKLTLRFLYDKLDDVGGFQEDDDGLEISIKLIKEFIHDVNEEFEGDIVDNILFKAKSGTLLKFPDDFTHDEWVAHIVDGGSAEPDIYILFKKEANFGFGSDAGWNQPEVMNQKFLNLSEYGFYATFHQFGDQSDDIIRQGYDFGEYDTGYYNPYEDKAEYIFNKESRAEYWQKNLVDEFDQVISLL
mgnify:CR=1 FL=1